MEGLRSRLKLLQKSIVEYSYAKDKLHKDGMRSFGQERISFFQEASKYANEIASLRKEINNIFKQLKKKRY